MISERRICACHNEPMLAAGTGEWACRVKHYARYRRYRQTQKGRVTSARGNAKRISLGATYLGTENQFPAPREAVMAFVRNLKEASLGTHE